MNHAAICKFYYGVEEETEILNYPEIKRLEFYFNGLHARDKYYTSMKYHAIHKIKNMYPQITLIKLGKILNVHHATVIHYLDKYVPISSHKEFISNYFDRFVDNQIYPLTPKNSKDKNKYGEFRPTTLEEIRRWYKPKTEKTRSYKKKPATFYYKAEEYKSRSC
jgi:hypothetical protein